MFYANTQDKALNKLIENEFVYKSRMAGFLGLGGHRHVGGLRSTVYNAVTQESADALVQFIKEFEKDIDLDKRNFEHLKSEHAKSL